MKRKIVAILCALALLIPIAALPASALASWTSYSQPQNIDYSFVAIGDMQSMTWTDNRQGTSYVKSVFDWILNNKKSRKIEYVFGLGDTIDTLTTYSTNKVAANGKTQNVNEWELASAQIHRLDGIVPYTIVRGNHDDEGGYHKYICTSAYTSQMDGFYYDPSKPATLGNSMSNSFKKIELGGGKVKYLMLSLDYNADSGVMAWANEVISSNPDYRVIVSIHAYINGGYSGGVGAYEGFLGGTIGAANADNSAQVNSSFSGSSLWNNVFSKHENMFMILCGHDAIPTPVHNVRTGKNGTQVIEILTDTSKYDLEQNGNNYGGSLMMLLNFRESTGEIQVEYFSPSRKAAGYSNYHLANEQVRFTYSDFKGAFEDDPYEEEPPVVEPTEPPLYEALDDATWKPLTRELGLHTYVGAPMTTSPVTNGTVTSGEYSCVRYLSPDDLVNYSASETPSGITEYIAHDADYIYYAVSFTQEVDNRALKWEFNPLNSFDIYHDKTDLKTTLFQRVSWQLRYLSDGIVQLYQSPSWQYSIDKALPQIGTDIQYAATKTSDNLKTYEIKLSKAYLAKYNNCDKEDIKVMPYMTIFHDTTTISHNYTQEEVNILKSYGATRAELGSAPAFMVFEEAPGAETPPSGEDVPPSGGETPPSGEDVPPSGDVVEPVIIPITQQTSSIRISDDQPGLRFKTTISEASMNALIRTYGIGNVAVGTLIAPTDTLGTKSLTHKFGTLNVDYIDVVASVTKPFAMEGGIITYAGTISNIKQKNLGRDFTAVGYVAYRENEQSDWIYIYSEASVSQNIDHVATETLETLNANIGDALEQPSVALNILEKLTVAYYKKSEE